MAEELVMRVTVTNIVKAAGDVMYGDAEILGARFQFMAIKVTNDEEDDGTVIQYPTDDPIGYLEQLESFAQAQCFHTVQIPGWDGDWVMWLTPKVVY